jgi:Ca2+-transporting ATPase
MQRKPRAADEQILPGGLLLWLVFAGLVLGGTSLGVIWWADDEHGEAVARTMGLTTFAIANVLLAYTVKDRFRSVLSLDSLADRKLLLATGLSAVAILFGTELRILQRILGTVSLTGEQWVICLLAALSVFLVSEVQKLVLRRRVPAPAEDETPTAYALGPTA